MADDKLNVNPALPQDGDDTVTRKTIKLRPAIMPGSPVATPAVSPRPAANTDTGNIDLADDTQTRRTIKLKPVSPIHVTPPASPATPVAPSAAAAPAPAADGDDTVTRKTIKLRPAVPGAAAPAATPAAAPAAASTAEDSGEKTIRIQRPVIKPVTGPAVSSSPVSAAPAVKSAPQMQSVKLPTFQKPESPAAVPTHAPSSLLDADEEYEAAEFVPSKACLIMSIIALICMIYSTLLITVQFLDVTQNQKTAESVSFLVPDSK